MVSQQMEDGLIECVWSEGALPLWWSLPPARVCGQAPFSPTTVGLVALTKNPALTGTFALGSLADQTASDPRADRRPRGRKFRGVSMSGCQPGGSIAGVPCIIEHLLVPWPAALFHPYKRKFAALFGQGNIWESDESDLNSNETAPDLQEVANAITVRGAGLPVRLTFVGDSTPNPYPPLSPNSPMA